MWRILFIGFLISHGLIHLAIWAAPKAKNRPFDPAHSWLVGDHRAPAMVFALAAMLMLVGSGIGLWAHAGWWRPVAIAGLCTSLALMTVYFHPWFGFIQAVNLALIIGLLWLNWPSRATLGG